MEAIAAKQALRAKQAAFAVGGSMVGAKSQDAIKPQLGQSDQKLAVIQEEHEGAESEDEGSLRSDPSLALQDDVSDSRASVEAESSDDSYGS